MRNGNSIYTFDPIGNRLTATNNTAITTYFANELNQYTNIVSGASVTPIYDDDGNMLTIGNGWTATWDGENRLIRTVKGGLTIAYAYDHMGRRVSKTVGATTHAYVYDGWNLIAETDGTTVQRYVWGPDLSGSLDGAGGVGGLLAVIQNGETFFACGDGNGNVTDYVDTNGTVVAHREYDPFGGTIALTGSKKDDFNFWFSTRYLDRETGLYMYPYRPYSPPLGRFLCKDPAEEQGGKNLYSTCNNDLINLTDAFGLWGSHVHHDHTRQWSRDSGYMPVSAEWIAQSDEAVDGGVAGGGRGWAPWGDQSYHFNLPWSDGRDTRLQHYAEHLRKAFDLCDWSKGQDKPWDAATELGTALHPLQDYVAHGDFGRNQGRAVIIIHNAQSPQREFGNDPTAYPDDDTLDAQNGPDGRPSGAGYYRTMGTYGMEFAWFIKGSRRITKTEQDTKYALTRFKSHVLSAGKPCGECRKYFFDLQP